MINICGFYLLKLLIFTQLCWSVLTFNLNVDLHKVFTGDPNDPVSYFGYTTDFLVTKENPPRKWILVGAPKGMDSKQLGVTRPGVLFKCNHETTDCTQVTISTNGNVEETDSKGTRILNGKDNGWLGASLAVGEYVTVCAPRWLNKIEQLKVSTPMFYMNGICYEMPRVLDEGGINKYALLSDESKQTINDTAIGKYYFHYQYGQMGMSVQYSKEQVSDILIGAPGLRDASGGMIELSQDPLVLSENYDDGRNNDYFGYALTPGRFLGDGKEYIALGGPRGNGTGQVKIVEVNGAQYTVRWTISGEETGSYFGSVLCSVNVNMTNNKDVLVVGAPFFGNLTNTNVEMNQINEDEGKVYVYGFSQTEGRLTQIQQLKGSGIKNARYGSAICSPGDINKDGAADLAVGAPFEGNGVVYIYNGYQGKFWPTPTQKIDASLSPLSSLNLEGFGSYLSQNKMDIDGNSYEDLLIGAPYSNKVIMLKSNPTISMDVELQTSLTNNIIKKQDTQFAVQVCFKYTGVQDLPVDVTVNYTVNIDYYMTRDNKLERVFAVSGSNQLTGQKRVIRSLNTYQCSDNYTIQVQQSRSDIVTPVAFIVNYAITQQAGTGQDCTTTPCPVINIFNAKRQIPDADSFKELIEFEKPGCGLDNKCNTDLRLSVTPEYNYGASDVLIRGPEAGFHLSISVVNLKESSYDTIITIDSENYISYITKETLTSNHSVTCDPQNIEDNTKSVLECQLSDLETPFQTAEVVRFKVYFDASRTPVVNDFLVDIKLKTRSNDIDMSNNQKQILMKVESRADIKFDGDGYPELYVTSKTQLKDGLLHRFDFTNNGPTELTSPPTFTVAYPSVIINGKSVLKMSSLNFVVPLYNMLSCGSNVDVRQMTDNVNADAKNTTYLVTLKDTSVEDNLNYNCDQKSCIKIECKTSPLGVKALVTISLRFEMEANILAQVQGKEKVDSLSLLSIATVTMPDNLLLSSSLSHSATAKTDVVPAEQVKEKVAWWIVLICVLAGVIVLIGIALILWRCGFFRRKAQEDLAKRKQYAEKKDDQENLIQNGKDKEKEAAKDITEENDKPEVSAENFDELDKMLKEVQDYA